jgi:hypothetical protein
VNASTEKVTIWPYRNRRFIQIGDEERRPVSEKEAMASLRS